MRPSRSGSKYTRFSSRFLYPITARENSSMATGSRKWAAAGLIGIMMCVVAVLQMWGSDTRSAMSNTGVEEGVPVSYTHLTLPTILLV